MDARIRSQIRVMCPNCDPDFIDFMEKLYTGELLAIMSPFKTKGTVDFYKKIEYGWAKIWLVGELQASDYVGVDVKHAGGEVSGVFKLTPVNQVVFIAGDGSHFARLGVENGRFIVAGEGDTLIPDFENVKPVIGKTYAFAVDLANKKAKLCELDDHGKPTVCEEKTFTTQYVPGSGTEVVAVPVESAAVGGGSSGGGDIGAFASEGEIIWITDPYTKIPSEGAKAIRVDKYTAVYIPAMVAAYDPELAAWYYRRAGGYKYAQLV